MTNHYRSYATLFKPIEGFHVEPSPRWIRGFASDDIKVVESKNVFIGWEGSKLIPFWAFPREDVIPALKEAGAPQTYDRKWFDIHLNTGETISNAAWLVPAENTDYKDLIVIEFKSLKKWLEDDELVIGHPRSPYKGLDTRKSSRSVKVVIEGQTVAETNNAIFLYENGHPTRYYFNTVDIQGLHYFSPSTYRSACAYKGVASYFNAEINGKKIPNVVWTYLDPAPEVARIQGRWSFWNETVDIYVDGQKLPRPAKYIVHTSP